jgi:hypothetical protein
MKFSIKTRFRCHSAFVKLKRTDSDSMKFKSRLMLNLDVRSSCKWILISTYAKSRFNKFLQVGLSDSKKTIAGDDRR